MKNVGHRFSSVAVMLLIVSSSAAFATHDIHGKANQDRAQSMDKAPLWHVRSNGCALGNSPPPGTNC